MWTNTGQWWLALFLSIFVQISNPNRQMANKKGDKKNNLGAVCLFDLARCSSGLPAKSWRHRLETRDCVSWWC